MVSLTEEHARKKFKNPEIFAKAYRLVVPTTPTLLLDRNPFRISAKMVADASTVWVSHSRAGVARAADRIQIERGSDGFYWVITSNQQVWCISTSGTEAIDVWEEYWDESKR